MSSQSGPSSKLPLLDFSTPESTKTGSSEWESLKPQVRKALEEYGCFEACFDNIPSDLLGAVYRSTEEIFELPLASKQQNVSEKPYHGYVGHIAQVPLYESLGIDGVTVGERVEALANTMWPQGNPTFSKTIESYAEKLSELDKTVRKMIAESFGLEKYIDDHINSTSYLLRLSKYNGLNTPGSELGLAPHTDKNWMTILHQDQVEGLELQTKDGSWIKFQSSTPNSFIVMISESLGAWLNGRLGATCHRVMMYGNEARYSLGLFSFPKHGFVIEVPDQMVDEEHPLQFKPFYYEEFLSFFYTKTGQAAPCALRAFCGV
ncbi:unnamed protein product [Linum tenue]|uniref:Fe2OG dioxygenase domain-containing protein n=1 Tax=Linum tenue TaxID=586396 RepID=A0AAV0NLD4_9ROSI|nr:unnamed protein product [Linum tenue]